MENIIVENFDIPIVEDNINLKSSIYYNSKTASKATLVINCAGLLDHRGSPFVQMFTKRFVNAGYYVLSYDYRAHGETKKQTRGTWLKHIFKIFTDINDVINWIFENQSHRLLDDDIVLFGRSLGAAMILSQGYINERAKKLIALCARYDYAQIKNIEFPEDVIKHISPRYYLKKDPLNYNRILIAHCEDDPRIPFEHFLKIKEHLGFENENAIKFETGGHSFRGHRDDLFEKIIKFLNNK